MDAKIITLTLFAVAITLWILWRKRKLSLFKRLGIPGPEPSFFFGNYRELITKGQHNCIKEWIKEYGRVFGYYYGLRPVLIVADLELLRTIQLKEFHKFSNRPPLFELGKSSKEFNEHAITTATAQKWKYMRSIITPTFTTSKLKTMNPIIMNSVNELYDAVEKVAANEKTFNIYHLYQNLTMDVIARTSLGIHSEAQSNKNEPLVKLTRILFSISMNYFLLFAYSFSEFMSLFSTMNFAILSWSNKGRHPRAELMDKTAAAIALRRRDPNSRRRDLLQLLMEAQRTEENISDSNLTAEENDDQVSNGPSKQISAKSGSKLTDEEVLHNANTFLLAGYETTSTALAFTTHELVNNLEIQDKVREEIRNNIADPNNITYEDLHKLQYLDKVIHESLRMHPPITYFVMRRAAEDTVIEGTLIPKDVAIQVPVYFLHYDSTSWEDPEKFDPERFSPEAKASRHPMTYQPFGAGPRNCVGMRFALAEMKMALAKLLYDFKFLPSEKEFEVSHTIVIDRPKNGVHIKAVKV